MCLKGAVGSMKNRTRDERDQPLWSPIGLDSFLHAEPIASNGRNWVGGEGLFRLGYSIRRGWLCGRTSLHLNPLRCGVVCSRGTRQAVISDQS